MKDTNSTTPRGPFQGPAKRSEDSETTSRLRDGRAPSEGPRLNSAIRAPQVRVVGENGEMIGVLSRKDALDRALDAGLDLVEVSPDADPPVCKILDYGKYKYHEQKKLAAARKKQKVVEIKEIKVRPVTDENDYQVKLRAMKRFIEEGNKVKVVLRFKGREISHHELGLKVLERMKSDMELLAKVELDPKFEGRQMIMMLGPK
ncbi:MAG: translation initiation factor IF-3 [Proteobacteria bacterium]|nr:translation initiation factor IF-3 [Pseudomonadota bacterium]